MKKYKIFFITILMIIITSCGFSIVEHSDRSTFDIAEIKTSGNNKINYKIKNKILFGSSKNDKKLISLNLDSKKSKSVKEKNIKNEITKYQIKIEINIEVYEINNSKKIFFRVVRAGDYDVASQYSQTLNNEKKLVNFLIDNISEQILDELTVRLNAL